MVRKKGYYMPDSIDRYLLDIARVFKPFLNWVWLGGILYYVLFSIGFSRKLRSEHLNWTDDFRSALLRIGIVTTISGIALGLELGLASSPNSTLVWILACGFGVPFIAMSTFLWGSYVRTRYGPDGDTMGTEHKKQ
jgi:uncharacterized membrane protein YczE